MTPDSTHSPDPQTEDSPLDHADAQGRVAAQDLPAPYSGPAPQDALAEDGEFIPIAVQAP